MIKNAFFGLIGLLVAAQAIEAAAAPEPQQSGLRGFNVDTRLNEQDFGALKEYGANSIRLSFPHLPLMSLKAPYSFNELAFRTLDRYLQYANQYQLKVIIDPHVYPGMTGLYSMKPSDPFWMDEKYGAQLVRLWDEIARRYAGKPEAKVIVGYDIINEPAPPAAPGGGDRCSLLNKVVADSVKAIRKHDKTTAVYVEFPMGLNGKGNATSQVEGVDCLALVPDAHVVYSFHMYDPGHFTHQGVGIFETPASLYNGASDEIVRGKLATRMQPIVDFQKRTNSRIFVGEFGASSFTGSEGVRYINILLGIFEQQGWDWAFHSFRESAVWNPETPVIDKATLKAGVRKIDVLQQHLQGPSK